MVNMLTDEEVIFIHECLTRDAELSEDPISPLGIKNIGSLSSAVARQKSGYDDFLKYPDPILNAASLCYGICLNHPFHNGNKRAALVALLCHLDKNNITFNEKVTQQHLYSFMLKIAGHTLLNLKKKNRNDYSDEEVKEMEKWLKKRTRKCIKNERTITFIELERILREHNIYFENHKNNYVDLVRHTRIESLLPSFIRKPKIDKEVVANIPYFPNREVGKNLIKSIRKQAGLTYQNGIDSEIFYGNQRSADYYILNYRKVLSQLAKT